MQEAGLMERWKTVWWRSPTSCSSSAGPSSSSQSLSVTSVGGIFLVVAVMSALSLLILAVECYVFKLIMKGSKKKRSVSYMDEVQENYHESRH